MVWLVGHGLGRASADRHPEGIAKPLPSAVGPIAALFTPFLSEVVPMRLRMLESVTRMREGRIYLQSYALEAGDTYELAPDYAQLLVSSGKAVPVEGALHASLPGASRRNVLSW
jgi:hypothetical protein